MKASLDRLYKDALAGDSGAWLELARVLRRSNEIEKLPLRPALDLARQDALDERTYNEILATILMVGERAAVLLGAMRKHMSARDDFASFTDAWLATIDRLWTTRVHAIDLPVLIAEEFGREVEEGSEPYFVILDRLSNAFDDGSVFSGPWVEEPRFSQMANIVRSGWRLEDWDRWAYGTHMLFTGDTYFMPDMADHLIEDWKRSNPDHITPEILWEFQRLEYDRPPRQEDDEGFVEWLALIEQLLPPEIELVNHRQTNVWNFSIKRPS